MSLKVFKYDLFQKNQRDWVSISVFEKNEFEFQRVKAFSRSEFEKDFEYWIMSEN